MLLRDADTVITRHKLGFTVIPLVRIGPYRATLHWWPPGKSDPDIHSHRWDFTSVLLWGSLTEKRYVMTGGLGWAAFRCLPGCLPEAEPVREIRARQVGHEARRAPAWYTGRRGEFHAASTERGALTLFVQRRRGEEPYSVVLRASEQ